MELRTGYKQSEVGVIPDDWECAQIGSIIDLLTGHPFPSSGYSESGVRLLRGSNVKRGETDWDEGLTKYWPEISSELRKYQLVAGDIVVSMDGSLVGRSFAELGISDVPALLLQRVARVRSIRVDQSYLKTWICSKVFTEHCDSVKTTTAIPHISPADIRSFKIGIPPTRLEQSAIATALRDVDALLVAQDALIAKKRAIKQGAMQELLTGRRRLPGFSREWEVKVLGEHLEFLSNGANSRAELVRDGRVRYLHYGDIHGSNEALLDPTTTAMPFLPEMKAARLDRLKDGDLIFADASEDLDGVGKSIELKNVGKLEVVSGMHTIAVRFDRSILADGFKAYLQAIPTFQRHLRRLASGTKVYATNMSHIASAEVALPDAKEQIAISKVVSDMDTELTALETKRAKTAQLRQGMMQVLLTGRIRLV